MSGVRRLVALVLTIAAAGCGGSSAGPSGSDSGTSPTATATAGTQQVLPTGKELVQLDAGTYRSPDGFVPGLTVTVPAGWGTSHRFDDAFDISRHDPTRDAPAVAVIWMTPAAATAAEALATVKAAAGPAATDVTGRVGTAEVPGLDITDGSGTVVESVRRGIALDAEKGQRLRVLGVDLGGKPLLVVVLVPVKASWDRLSAGAQQLIDSVRPA
jgi:hypothetical protein